MFSEQHSPQDWAAFVREKALLAKSAVPALMLSDTAARNNGLRLIADAIDANHAAILAANAQDVALKLQENAASVMVDRLQLTEKRLLSLTSSIRAVAAMPDPLNVVIDSNRHPNGMHVQRIRCPLGLVGLIYESRPNVTVDASVLCLKSGNAALLKGGSDALHSNRALVQLMQHALEKSALPANAIQLIDTAEREAAKVFLELEGVLDVIIPRGSAGLISATQQAARVPIIETGASVVHAYVDCEVDMPQAVEMIINSKMRRPTICNALDVLLVHQHLLEQLAPLLGKALATAEPQLQIRADHTALQALKPFLHEAQITALHTADYDTEFLDYIMAVHTVNSLDDALLHIAKHSLKHTEAIYTTNATTAERFLASVDAACVMHNASTQFTDGAEFGLGAEMGISTQKLHTRGPFALEGLTTVKWQVRGNGQTRPL